MINTILSYSSMLLSQTIEKEQWLLFRVISGFLGEILNFVFKFFYGLGFGNSLGLSIIFFTIIVKTIMIPFGIKQQKSMTQQKKLQPLQEKIKAKYKNTEDPELKKKMNIEIQALYAEHKVNPLSGCLPLLITLPILIALSYILRNSINYVEPIQEVYADICDVILRVPNILNILTPMIYEKMTVGMDAIEISDIPALSKALSTFFNHDWAKLLEQINLVDPAAVVKVQLLLDQKAAIDNFVGINLVDAPGYMWPNIIIPILSGASSFVQSYVLGLQTTTTDPSQKTTQKMMLYVMPLVMAWMTTTFSAGVGLYWITLNIFSTVQQFILGNYYNKKLEEITILENQPKKIVEIKNIPKNKKGER